MIRLRELPPPPSNDSCASPAPIEFGGDGLARVEGSLVGARSDHEQLDCGEGLADGRGRGPDVVHRFTVGARSRLRAFPLDGEGRVEVHLVSACDGDDGLACFDSSRGLEDGVELNAGNYFLRVEPDNGLFGLVQLPYAFLLELQPL